MKLLFDENVSDRIVQHIEDLFPESKHVNSVGLKEAEDDLVWDWAKRHKFTIVSKDTDFHQRAVVFGRSSSGCVWATARRTRSRAF